MNVGTTAKEPGAGERFGEPEKSTVPRILSIQSRTMGHATYGELMQKHFAALAADPNRAIDFDFHWSDEGRGLLSRIDCRIGEQRLPGAFIRRNNLDFGRYRAELAYARRSRRLLKRLLSESPSDVLHFHTQVPALAALPLIRRIPTVITADITAVLVAREAADSAFQWTHAPSIALERRIFAAANRVVFWSQWALNSFITDLGMPPEKGAVIPPGVNVASFPAGEWAQARAERAAKNEPVRLLFVGADFERKGGHDLLAAFQKAGLAGRAELHLVTTANIPSDPPHVFVHHGIGAYTPEWLTLFGDADAFVFPTHFDGLGIAVMEAAAAGLPVISNRVNAIPEMVSDGENGFLVESGDIEALSERMNRIVSDAQLRLRMGDMSRKMAEEHFDTTRNFGRLGDIFRQAATEPR